MSHILNITVPDTVYETLTRTARQTGQPLEAVATKWLAAAAEQFAHDPLDPFIGAFDSGGIDWADKGIEGIVGKLLGSRDISCGATGRPETGDDELHSSRTRRVAH